MARYIFSDSYAATVLPIIRETGRRGPRSTAGPGKQQQHF
jgi:hypothetical protein